MSIQSEDIHGVTFLNGAVKRKVVGSVGDLIKSNIDIYAKHARRSKHNIHALDLCDTTSHKGLSTSLRVFGGEA